MAAELNREYWRKHWASKAVQEDSLEVAGWGNRPMEEYLLDVQDVCRKLKLSRDTRLLNVGLLGNCFCSSDFLELHGPG